MYIDIWITEWMYKLGNDKKELKDQMIMEWG